MLYTLCMGLLHARIDCAKYMLYGWTSQLCCLLGSAECTSVSEVLNEVLVESWVDYVGERG